MTSDLSMLRVHLSGIGTFIPRTERDLAAALRTAKLIDACGDAAFGRDPATDHITASAFIVSPDRRQTLLMHHAKLDRWLQPGGHCDGESDVRASALREAHEETGLSVIVPVTSEIFDIDVHQIPARKGDPAHWHHDIRFVFEASPEAPLSRNGESKSLEWVPLDKLPEVTDVPAVLVIRDRIGLVPEGRTHAGFSRDRTAAIVADDAQNEESEFSK